MNYCGSTELNTPVKNTAAASPPRVLVIDDEEVAHLSLRRILGRRGFAVETVFTAQEGLDLLLAGSIFDLVISDLMMPGMDGMALLAQLKQRQIQVRTRVLMVTGYPTIRTALQALRLGAVDYLAKPFTRQELLGSVSRALSRVPEARPTGEVTVAAPASTWSDDGIEAPRRALLPGDRVRLRRHAWAVFQQDGSMEIGIERSFLASVVEVASIDLPQRASIIEQGYVGFRLRSPSGEEHGVFMPVSGPVVEVNDEALSDPQSIDAGTWLVRVIPNRLPQELAVLSQQDG